MSDQAPPAATTPSAEQLASLRCPACGQALSADATQIVCASGEHTFAVSPEGIPLFAAGFCSAEAEQQQAHYDTIAADYVANMGYPHTREYLRYLDRVYFECLPDEIAGENQTGKGTLRLGELCCGHGEALHLLAGRYGSGVGVDVSARMLAVARRELPAEVLLLQADATRLPIPDGQLDHVVMLGGIHHVPARQELFDEIYRVLRPGGVFSFREPASDFFLWRGLRALIYRWSPLLDADTERPLLYTETVPLLEQSGFTLAHWRTCGFFGFCLLMNSDVLVFNRLFRFIPGIRVFTRLMAAADELTVRIPGLRRAGLQVVGIARKPG